MTDSPRVAVESFELTLLQRVRDVLQERNSAPQATLQRCLHEIAHSCRADHVVLATLRPDTRARIDIGIGLTSEQMQHAWYRLGEGVIGQVIKTGEPLAAEQGERELAELTHAWPVAEGNTSRYLCVPVFSRSVGVIGALGVDRCRPEAPWMRDDLRLLTVISALLAPCVAALHIDDDLERHPSRQPVGWLDVGRPVHVPTIHGESAQTQRLMAQLAQTAADDGTVLFQGERGVGKGLAAREVHAQSRRHDRPLVSVSCAALVGATAEGDLFGHVKGTASSGGFTRRGYFGRAEGGTIVLDEISELPMALQAKLLRVLRERTIQRVGEDTPQHANVRVFVSTHVDLLSAVRARTFREDLHGHLIATSITIPPLRERRADIATLARHFCEVFRSTHRCPPRELAPATIDALINHDWPGNVRELESVILHALLIARGPRIEVDDLPLAVRPHDLGAHSATDTLEQRLSEFERETILDAMREAGGDHTKAARTLQTTPRILSYRLRRLGACAAE